MATGGGALRLFLVEHPRSVEIPLASFDEWGVGFFGGKAGPYDPTIQ